jgi:hypothetical protein
VVKAQGLDPKEKISWDQTREIARDLGLSPAELETGIAGKERLSGAEMLAVRNLIKENTEGIVYLQRELATRGSSLGEETVRAMEMAIEAAEKQNAELLDRFVRARTNAGRDLNNLKILANQSMDPVIWKARVKKLLNDQGRPMTAEIEARIQKIIDSCES